jgi:hypothetical protein
LKLPDSKDPIAITIRLVNALPFYSVTEGSVLSIPKGTQIEWSVANNSNANLCFGLLAIDGDGDLQPMSILREIDQMFVPPWVTTTMEMKMDERASTYEFHLIISPQVKSSLVFSPSGMEKGVMAPIVVNEGRQITFRIVNTD